MVKKILKRTTHEMIVRRLPSRPRAWLQKAQDNAQRQLHRMVKLGLPIATNPAYVAWLKKESMLESAQALSEQYSGTGSMWRRPYATPQPRRAVHQASVWYTAYPAAMMTPADESILSFFDRDEWWQTFETIGIRAMHTGPMKIAGGLYGWEQTPTVDGHFDRIGTRIDGIFGTEQEYQTMVQTAARHGAIIIDDIIPGHTGKGADFRLAEMGHEDYPGIYHMVEIDRHDWNILPDVPDGDDAINIDSDCEAELKKRGYIVGKLYRVIFHEPGVKETNWSVTAAVRGTDGKKRRWVYLHYFKMGQPSLNWLDPSFAGMRLVVGDAMHSLNILGSRGLRLDANGFLGIEVSDQATDAPAWSEGHPMSRAANQVVASMVRKLGGFTFQELNLSMDDIKSSAEFGADLSYDFVNRPAYHHALATGNADFLRITTRSALEIGIDPVSLVHALQNHDELTTELVHFWTAHAEDYYHYDGRDMTGRELRDIVRADLRAAIADRVDYNIPFTENGIACTNASAIAAMLGYSDISALSAEQIAMIRRAHILLVMFNAWQPGVVALSGWDLAGALTLPRHEVADLLEDGDTRWVNRGAYDLLGIMPDADQSPSGMKRAVSLYGSLPSQLADPHSFVSQLTRILAHRQSIDLATSTQIAITDVSTRELFAMIHRLESGRLQITVLNFSHYHVRGAISSDTLLAGTRFVAADQPDVGEMVVDDAHAIVVELEGFAGVSLVEV